MNISMIVLNAVTHDVRVMKEAQALVSEGHRVTIVGAQDKKSPEHEVVHGIEIFRILRSNASLTRMQAASRSLMDCRHILIGYGLLLLAASLFAVGINSFSDLERWVERSISHLVNMPIVPLLIASAGLAVFMGRPIKRLMLRAFRQLLNVRTVLKQMISIAQYKAPALAILEHSKPEILHCHDLSGLMIGVHHRRKHPCKVIYDSHEIFEETHNSTLVRKWVVRHLQRKLAPLCDALIVVNESAAQYINTKYPAMPKATVVKNASSFITPPSPHNYIREALGLPREKKILLFQGGFTMGRGLPQLTDAAQYLSNDWVLVYMGWGNMEGHLRSRAVRQHTLDRKIFFLPKVGHDVLADWTSSADIGMIPYENTCLNHLYCTPNKLWEYPIAGVPIIATELVELAKTVRQYEIGWIIKEPLDPRNIAEVVNGITDEQLAHARTKCAEFVRIENWQKYEQVLLDLYHRLGAMPVTRKQAA